MELKAIKRKSLYEEIIEQIIKYIQNKGFKPGDRLPSESEFAKTFQVSKTAVREAMSVLAAKGILEKRPGVGSLLREIPGSTFVEQVTSQLLFGKKSLMELLEFRRGIEVESAALAARRASEEQLEAIEAANIHLIEANNKGQIGIEEDYRFHYLIILSSGNSIYEMVFDSVASKFMDGIKITKIQSQKISGRYIEECHEEHGRILKALRSRDAEEARRAMYDHLNKNEKKIWGHPLPEI